MKIIQVYSTFNIYFILFVALLATIVSSSKSNNADPESQCRIVSKAFDNEKLVEYDTAKKCIESFPFDAKFADDTIDAVSHFMSSYYVFLDQAKEEPPKGFTYQPVDLIKELNSLREKTFKSDYGFITALRNTIFKLKDGHTRFIDICYQSFIYDQNLTLYSVVTTDKEKKQKQIIKIFDDKLDSSNNDCEVTEIEGKPAIQAIIDFANDNIAYSKDLGVRFNMALAPSIKIFSQLFTLREDLPETSTITYNLKCPKKSYKLTRKWSVAFSSAAFENFCFDTRNNSAKITSRDKSTGSTSSGFYLVNDGKVGVAVITDESTNSIFGLADGLRQLTKRGAEKLILDMSNNVGGDPTVPLFTSLLLFPSSRSRQPNFFPTSININNFTIPIIKKNFDTNSSDSDDYNPFSFLSFPSGEPFKNVNEFIGPRKNLTSGLHLNPLTSDEVQLLKSTSPFRWTSDEMIILTNGFCISACALAALYLSEFYKIKTIAVGGLLDTSMSFSTFPGGLGTSENVIADEAGDNNIEVPGGNSLLLAIREAYDFNKNNITTGVLEYLFKPADYRLYYNESNARDPSFLWVDAANILNKKP
ncbi:peptidase s41 family protein [Gigaspora margarita]|uniref:Peptidase s41 family protein n=1 Tax=Gigaspora margarita TaxID=4874 RepID=A0A8H4AYN0_GIGMA|nr:peptidase s41 family protein [Gigaspora margarita]